MTRRLALARLLGVVLVSSGVVAAAGDTRVADAAKQRDHAAIQALLATGATPGAAQADGTTALHWAAYWDDAPMAELLLRRGAKARVANDLQVTPVGLACTNGNGALVTRLLAAGADPGAGAVPPLHHCARAGSLAGVTALLAAGATVQAVEPVRQQTALMWAAAHDRADVVRLLLQRGAQPQARSRVSRRRINRADPNDVNLAVIGEVNEGGWTALMLAARTGSVAAVRGLLEGGAMVDAVAPDGSTALVVAAHSDQTATATLLLEHGANPNVIGSGYTALHAAVLRGNAELAAALIARKANVNSRLRNGTATTRGTRDYFFYEGLTGGTPAWLAARFLEPALLRLLTAAGADWRQTPPDGTPALAAAAGVPAQGPLFDRRHRLRLLRTPDEREALETVTWLLDLGADPGGAGVDGNTPLHGAAAQNYPSVIRRLVERGASLTATNRAGQTPLAVANGPDAVSALRALGATR